MAHMEQPKDVNKDTEVAGGVPNLIKKMGYY